MIHVPLQKTVTLYTKHLQKPSSLILAWSSKQMLIIKIVYFKAAEV